MPEELVVPYTLSAPVKEEVKVFYSDLVYLCATFVSHAQGADPEFSQAQAINSTSLLLVDVAAVAAARNAKFIQGREPNPEKWKEATQAAFERALETIKDEKHDTEQEDN